MSKRPSQLMMLMSPYDETPVIERIVEAACRIPNLRSDLTAAEVRGSAHAIFNAFVDGVIDEAPVKDVPEAMREVEADFRRLADALWKVRVADDHPWKFHGDFMFDADAKAAIDEAAAATDRVLALIANENDAMSGRGGGRPKKLLAPKVVVEASRVWEVMTGAPPPRWSESNSKRRAPFVAFVQDVFEALGVEGSAVRQVKSFFEK